MRCGKSSTSSTRPCEAAEEREQGLPHRATVLRLNRRLAQRILDAHRQWLDEVEHEL